MLYYYFFSLSHFLFVCISSLEVSNGLLNAELLFCNALTRSIIRGNYACPVWVQVALSSLQKLQILENTVLETKEKSPRHARKRDLHHPFNTSTMGKFMEKIQAKQA
jgi:hypothetical protein